MGATIRSNLRDLIAQSLREKPDQPPAEVAAQVAMTFMAQAIQTHSPNGFPLAHTEDCNAVADDTCTCGLDDLHYDLIWARMFPARLGGLNEEGATVQ